MPIYLLEYDVAHGNAIPSENDVDSIQTNIFVCVLTTVIPTKTYH